MKYGINDIVTEVAERGGFIKSGSKEFIGKLFEFIVERVAAGDVIYVPGFGKFDRYYRRERTIVDPITKKRNTYEGVYIPAFDPSTTFKRAVRNGKE